MKNASYQCKFKVNESTLTQYSVGESAAATLTSLRVSVPGCKCVRVSVREHNTHTSERTLNQDSIYICSTIERLIDFVLKERI